MDQLGRGFTVDNPLQSQFSSYLDSTYKYSERTQVDFIFIIDSMCSLPSYLRIKNALNGVPLPSRLRGFETCRFQWHANVRE